MLALNCLNKLPISERKSKFVQAVYIGLLALMENRLSSFFSETSNELRIELESLKQIFDMKKELFYKTAVKGLVAEGDIAETPILYFGFPQIRRHLPDK